MEEASWQAAVRVKRAEIDCIDAEIMRLLGERGKLVYAVGELKPHLDTVRVPEREQQIIERAAHLALEHGLEPDFGRQLYLFLIEYFATREQDQVMRRGSRLATEPYK